jgi:methyl-accepting chemotaxis protein
MAVNTQSARPSDPVRGGGPVIKRRLRNYLLDARFQLKYTGYVVVVTLLVASTLGYLAYQESRAQTEMLTIGMAMQGETEEFIARTAAAYDRNMLLAIIAGVLSLTVALGLTGILVTHRVVGPAYKLKLLMQHVADGHLALKGRLRKGDELQDVFLVFEAMIEKMRQNQRDEIDLLGKAIARAREGGVTDAALHDLDTLKTRMERELD